MESILRSEKSKKYLNRCQVDAYWPSWRSFIIVWSPPEIFLGKINLRPIVELQSFEIMASWHLQHPVYPQIALTLKTKGFIFSVDSSELTFFRKTKKWWKAWFVGWTMILKDILDGQSCEIVTEICLIYKSIEQKCKNFNFFRSYVSEWLIAHWLPQEEAMNFGHVIDDLTDPLWLSIGQNCHFVMAVHIINIISAHKNPIKIQLFA